VSERIVKDDVFTSIHIDEFEIGARAGRQLARLDGVTAFTRS
jgi:DNA-directed RNA polymerase beta subunit